MVGEKLSHFHCRGDNMCRGWRTVAVFGIRLCSVLCLTLVVVLLQFKWGA